MTRDNLKANPEVGGIKISPKRICSLKSFKVNGRLLSKITTQTIQCNLQTHYFLRIFLLTMLIVKETAYLVLGNSYGL